MTRDEELALMKDELRYLNLKAAMGFINHLPPPRKFKRQMECYEWLFNTKKISRQDLGAVSQIIFEHIHGKIDIEAELAALKLKIDGPPKPQEERSPLFWEQAFIINCDIYR
jgi:hypothetical protein